MPTITRPNCPSCGHPIDFLPGTLAVKCGACGSVLHVDALVPGGPGPRPAPPQVQVNVTLDHRPSHQSPPTSPSRPAADPPGASGADSIEGQRAAHERDIRRFSRARTWFIVLGVIAAGTSLQLVTSRDAIGPDGVNRPTLEFGLWSIVTGGLALVAIAQALSLGSRRATARRELKRIVTEQRGRDTRPQA